MAADWCFRGGPDPVAGSRVASVRPLPNVVCGSPPRPKPDRQEPGSLASPTSATLSSSKMACPPIYGVSDEANRPDGRVADHHARCSRARGRRATSERGRLPSRSDRDRERATDHGACRISTLPPLSAPITITRTQNPRRLGRDHLGGGKTSVVHFGPGLAQMFAGEATTRGFARADVGSVRLSAFSEADIAPMSYGPGTVGGPRRESVSRPTPASGWARRSGTS